MTTGQAGDATASRTGELETFATLLRRHRLLAGLSQEALAERAGLSVRGLSDLERGARQAPYPATIGRLADALGLDATARAGLVAAGRRAGASAAVVEQAPGRATHHGASHSAFSAQPAALVSGPAASPKADPTASPTVSYTASPTATLTTGLTVTPAGLPAQISSFIGREHEVSEICGLVDTTRLLTLAGPGGMGKTRLALEVARTVAEAGEWTVAVVELAPLTDDVSVPQTVAAALGIPEQRGRAPLEALVEAIGSHAALLVLDNCEHVVATAAQVADRLLRGCPRLRVLATSREPLGVAGEVLWRVPALHLPGPYAADLGRLASVEAVRLFVERARASLPTFALTEGNAAAVAEVCRRLEGIPLAIELAAARVRALSVEQIAARLDDRFRLLVGGTRTALPHQRTLAATLDWSYQLLSPAERALLRRLSVFAGGWTLEAAEAVCAGPVHSSQFTVHSSQSPPASLRTENCEVRTEDVLDLLTSLVDKSLVQAQADPDGGEERYGLLETVRQYAAARLAEAGEATEARDRHLAWAIDWAERSMPHVLGHDQVRWLWRIALEHDNFRAALEWSRSQGNGEAELRLAAVLGRFWHLHGPSSEGRAWLRHALAHSDASPSPARALALNWAGRLATVNGEADDRRLLEECVAMAGELGDGRLLALALRHLSMAAQRHGDEAAARTALAAALETAREAGDRREEAFALVAIGAAAEQAGDLDTAVPRLAEGLAIGREVGDAGPIGWALSVLGAIAAEDGRYDEAERLFEEALALSRPMGYWAVMVAALAQLGALERARGNLAAAWGHGRACITAAQEIGDLGLVAAALAFFGDLELQAGRYERGIRLLGAESAWRAALGARRFVSFWSWPAPKVDEARAQMGEEVFARAWAAGQQLSLEQAVAEALEERLA